MTLRKRLQAHGFEFTQTGGNCTAYIRTDAGERPAGAGPEIEEFITLETDAQAPARLTDRCRVTTRSVSEAATDYPHGGGYDGTRTTLATILRALDDPRDEYVLLEHRIENWYPTRPPIR